MLYNIDFSVAAFIILLTLFIFLKLQYNKGNASVALVKKLVFFLILADSGDIITSITISYPNSIPLWLNYLLSVLFFETNAICVFLFPKYINILLTEKNIPTTNRININDIILVAYTFICASTPWSHLIFYFDEELNYQHGLLHVLVFIFPLYFLVFSFFKLLFNKDAFNKKQFFSIVGFIAFAISGPTLQMLLPGNILVDFFALSIAAFIIIWGLETPDFIKLEKTLQELENHKLLLEEAKQKEETRSKALQEMTRSASWSIHFDEKLAITESYWSDEFFWLLGYEKDEVVERKDTLWSDSLHPDDAQKTIEGFMKGMQGVEPYDLSYRLRSKNGEYKWYRGTGELKTTENRKSMVYQGIIQDINDKVIRDELVKEKFAALEELEKSQQALSEAVKKAEAADRAKSDFLANMSHEIRTPINAVLGMNELIGRESTESNIQKYSSNVADAGHALLSLINDILDFSKIETGRMELAPSKYELSVILREVNNIISARSLDKGITFTIKNNPDIPNHLYGDEVRIRQILLNILSNALKYTDKGSVVLDVDYEQCEENKINLIFKAIDTGIGIKEENLPMLFEAFKRIDLKRNKNREGTGLGLSITKSFIQLMGGDISVESTYGKGSTFTVCIPQTVKGTGKLGILNTTKKATKKTYEPSFKAPNAHILVVDDVAVNLNVIKGLLRQTLISIDTVISGQECLDKIKDTHYDVILLDHMMPEMDGIETMAHMKADSTHANQDTPIIMLTANAIIGAREEYLEQGFADYLSKPFMPDELEAILIKHLPSKLVQTN